MRRTVFTALMGAAFTLASPVFAQDSTTNTGEDEVIARGSIQTDPAMSAWNAGDYATAEIEFDRNAFCALRVERGFRAGVESARESAFRADDFSAQSAQTATINGPGVGGGSVNIVDSASGVAGSTLNTQSLDRREDATKRTCENRGFQIYMRGMSQLKLGKTDEAKRSLEQATNLNRQLFDAHFRLSLMEYQSGDIDAAAKEARALRRIAKKCRRCNAKEEITAQLAYLDQLLGSAG